MTPIETATETTTITNENGTGRKRGRRVVKSDEYIRILNSLGYSFRLNLLNDRVEINRQPITDIIEAAIFTDLRDNGYSQVHVAKDAFIKHAAENAYHPIRDYLAGLSYDGGKHIDRLAQFFINPDGLFPLWLKRWLIGAVRRVLEPGEQNRVLVLDGPQDIGKSEFVKWLVPPALQDDHLFTGPIMPDSKDHKIYLMTRWVWEVSELGSTTRRADREALKGFISLTKVDERLPYARNPISKPALSNFIGTVNNEMGILNDPTGNRRFMFCKVNHIDWQGYTRDININDVWAEAQALHYAGEPADLTPDEKTLANGINAQYETEDSIEGYLMDYYLVDPERLDWWTATSDILRTLEDPIQGGYKGSSSLTSRQLAALMTRLGCQRKRERKNPGSNPVWGYMGVVKR